MGSGIPLHNQQIGQGTQRNFSVISGKTGPTEEPGGHSTPLSRAQTAPCVLKW